MTLAELAVILKATGYPVAYSHFNKKQTAPFICYKESFTDNLKADNKVYRKVTHIDVELYTSKKDLVAESNLEKVLEDNNIPWDAVETFIESENMYQRIYEIKL